MNDLARQYVLGYNKFLEKYPCINDLSESYNLFMYSMKKVYNLEAVEYNDYIRNYGNDCIDYLSKLPNTPKRKDSIGLLDRCALMDLCSFYLVLYYTL